MNPSSTDTAAEQPAGSRHYARTRMSQLTTYIFWPIVALTILSGTLYARQVMKLGRWPVLGLGLLLVVVVVWGFRAIRNAPHESFTIRPDSLEYTTYSSSNIYPLNALHSYTTYRDGTISIRLKGRKSSFISLSDNITGFEEIKQWLAAHYSDRRKVEEAKVATQEREARTAVLAMPDLGTTPKVRIHAMKHLRRITAALNVAGGLTLVFLWFPIAAGREWIIMAGLLMPLAAIGALLLYPTVLRLNGNKTNGYPGVTSAFLLPTLGLLVQTLAANIISYQLLWPVVGAVALVVGGLLTVASRYFLWRAKPAIGLGLLIGLAATGYSLGATAMVNTGYDSAAPAHLQVRVLERQRFRHRGNDSYFLITEQWSTNEDANHLDVNERVYSRTEHDSVVTIALHPGLLEAPWYEVVNK